MWGATFFAQNVRTTMLTQCSGPMSMHQWTNYIMGNLNRMKWTKIDQKWNIGYKTERNLNHTPKQLPRPSTVTKTSPSPSSGFILVMTTKWYNQSINKERTELQWESQLNSTFCIEGIDDKTWLIRPRSQFCCALCKAIQQLGLTAATQLNSSLWMSLNNVAVHLGLW